jgi:hypothetical protein
VLVIVFSSANSSVSAKKTSLSIERQIAHLV